MADERPATPLPHEAFPTGRDLRIAAAVVLALFAIYNLNFRDGGTIDAAGSTFLPVSILGEGDFDLDEFRPMIRNGTPPWFSEGLFWLGAMQNRDGHLLSSYPPGSGMLATPIYALPYLFGWLDDWHGLRVAGKLSASLLVALSAGFLFLTLRAQLSLGAALVLTSSYALGTSVWPIASQGMWQHGPGVFCLCAGLLALTRLERGGGALSAAAAGTALALAVVVRTTNIVPAGALALFVLVRHRSQLLPFAVPAALLGVWICWYNLSTFGDLSGGYAAVYASKAHSWRGHQLSNVFSNPLGYGLASILVSPSKGLLIYSPQMIFGLLGALTFWRWKRSALAPYLALWSFLVLILVAKNRLWWGGTAYGPRYLIEVTPALTLLMAAGWDPLRPQRALAAAFVATLALALSIQSVGAFFAPCGWATEPTWADRDPGRHWEWRDPEILRCLAKGLENGPLPPVLLHPELEGK